MEKISFIAIVTALYIFMQILSKSIAVNKIPYTLFDEKRVIAVAGRDKRIVLSCPCTKSIPVMWRKNGTILSGSKNTMMSLGSLTIAPVELSVEGLYECRSVDQFDNGYRAIFNVSIYEFPRILQRNKRHLFMNGSSADYLNCKANGRPKPDVFWINEKGFSPINPPSIIRVSETTLKVTNLKRGRSTVLICVAQNVHGRVKVKFKVGAETDAAKMPKDQKETKRIVPTPTTATVTMRTTTEEKGRRPVFKNRPSRINYAKLGQRLVIACDADGHPKPTIVISKLRPNKRQLESNIIETVKALNFGIYECKASNKYGVIKYPFLIKIRGSRRKIQNYTKRRTPYYPYTRSFSEWSSWSRCSASCGAGVQIRTRKCLVKLERFKNRLCYGRTMMRKSCFGRYCRRRKT